MSTCKILHIDDNELDLQLVSLSLQKRDPGIQISTATDGREGLEKRHGIQPDVIVSDYQMPGMSGLELLKQIRETGDRTPFIFLTGQGNESLAIEALRAGADDYFTKEEGFAHYERLLASINRLAEMYRQIRLRNEAEDMLRQSEERFRLASLAAADLIYEWYVDDDRLVWIGDVYSLLGYSGEELGTTASEFIRLIHPDDVQNAIDIISTRKESTEQFTIEYRIRDKRGKWLSFHVRGLPVIGANGRPVKWVGAATDVTEQREYEEKLEFQSQLLDQIHDAIIATDLEGTITYANAEEARLLGRDVEDLIGSSISTLGDEPDRGATQNEILTSTIEKGSWSGEVVNTTGKGERLLLHCSTTTINNKRGEVTGLVGIAREVAQE